MSELTDFGSDIIDNLTIGYTLFYWEKIQLYNTALKRSVFLRNGCCRCSVFVCHVNQNGYVRLKPTLFLSEAIRWWYNYCLIFLSNFSKMFLFGTKEYQWKISFNPGMYK